jgi:hypothetical protein
MAALVHGTGSRKEIPMNKLFLSATAAGLALAFGAASVGAQEVVPGAPAGPDAPAAGAAGDAANPFTVANIDPAAPFGTIDTNSAGADAEAVKAWAATLSDDLRLELTQRCEVIAGSGAAFSPEAASFCTLWATAQVADEEPLPGGAGPVPAGPPM